MSILKLDTVRFSADGAALEIPDQTLLPGRVEILRLTRQEDIHEAIRALRVRGAPAIGVAAAIGAALAAREIEAENFEDFFARFRE